MKLLYGTTNQAKLESMKRVTKILGLEIFGLNDLKNCSEFYNVKFPEIDELVQIRLIMQQLKQRLIMMRLEFLFFLVIAGFILMKLMKKISRELMCDV